jgi:hypothetical protein
VFGGVVVRFKALLWGLAIVMAGLAAPALAHSPYYSDSQEIPVAGGEPVSIKLLNGDGIFVADPMRAVIVDAKGRLLADTPVLPKLLLFCSGTGADRRCRAYDPFLLEVHEPDPAQWGDFGLIEEDGKPLAYPEHYGEVRDERHLFTMGGIGFTTHRASLIEAVGYELRSMAQSWQLTGIALVWWVLVWLPIRSLIRRDPEATGLVRAAQVILAILGLLAMSVISLWVWLIVMFSPLYLLLIFSAAGMLVWALPRVMTRQPA